MASSINASTTAGLVNTADTSGVLNIQTAGTTAISINASQAVSFTNAPTVTGGTANGVAYLNGSKVLTTGSALVFDGTNLGLGVTPSAWSGAKAFEIASSGSGICSFGATDVRVLGNAYWNGSAYKYGNTNLASMYVQNAGIHFWYNAASGTAGNTISWTTAMTLDASGNLVIGDTSTSGRFKVAVADNASFQSAGTFTNNVNADFKIRIKSSVTDLGPSTATPLTFSIAGTEAARIDSSGNLLVGTTSANGRLSIDSAGTTSATYIIFGRNSAASNKFTVRSDGAGFLDSAAWTYGSDATIKENIEYLEPSNCLSLLLNAKPAKFDYIEGQKANYGYIAQDVQKWLPEAVSETPNGKLGLQDGFINAIGTGAIQALHQLIQEQQALITQLQADVAALKGA